MKLSFRAKLILAMTLIVTGVTVATMWATQKRVRATYQHLYEEQFALQINYFSEKRIEDLQTAAANCDAVGKSIRVFAAMEAVAAGEESPDRIYDDIDEALKDVVRASRMGGEAKANLRKNMGGSSGPGRGKGPPSPLPTQIAAVLHAARQQFPGGAPTVSVLDAEGNLLLATRQGNSLYRRPTSLDDRDELRRLYASRDRSKPLLEQEIGYLTTEVGAREDASRRRGPGRAELRELIVTPIRRVSEEEPNQPQYAGTLVIGYPVHDFGEGQMYDFSDATLKSGIWLNGAIHSKTIPESMREDVSARVAEAIKTGAGAEHETITLNGVPHLLFFKVLNPESMFPTAAQVCLYSMREALVEQAAARTQTLMFGGLALLVGVGFILRISHGFSKPVEELARATQLVSGGDFTVKVPVRSQDEIGTLAASFNSMTEELALKERYKTVLAQVTDKEVAEQLISGKMSLGGEVKQVSVLFCDIRGFTALTENMPPAEVITMLNEHMTAMNQIVHKHYGVVDKFVGDLIMAVFGAPKSYGNDALHAVRCALKMIEERARLNVTTKHSFEIGIGVATGEVVAGCMGSEDRLNYTVLGERVNLASRLCSKAGRTELLIDETTNNLLPEGFVAEATEPLPLKGYSAPVPAFRLLEMNGVEFSEAELVPQPA